METNNPHFKKLMANLQKQIKFSKIFISILDKEQRALIDMDMGILMTLAKQKESGVRQMAYVDEQIKEASQALLGAPEEQAVTLKELCTILPEKDAQKIDWRFLTIYSTRYRLLKLSA